MCANANKRGSKTDRIRARLTRRGKLFPLQGSAFRMWSRHTIRASSDAACEKESLPKTRLWITDGALSSCGFSSESSLFLFLPSWDAERFSSSTRMEAVTLYQALPLTRMLAVHCQRFQMWYRHISGDIKTDDDQHKGQANLFKFLLQMIIFNTHDVRLQVYEAGVSMLTYSSVLYHQIYARQPYRYNENHLRGITRPLWVFFFQCK